MTTPRTRHYSRAELTLIADEIVGERLPGRPEQGIHESSTVQNYVIGSRLALPGARAYRYAQISGVAAQVGRAVANVSEDTEQALAAATSAIGARTVTITVQAAAGLVANELQGGELSYAWYYHHRIQSHPAALAGATCVLTLETPIVGVAVTIGVTTLVANPSLWRRVGHGATYASVVSFVGWPFDAFAVGQFTWVQTWGPVNGAPAVFFGDNINLRQVYFASDGSLTTFNYAAAQHDSGYQHAGFWIPSNCVGGPGGVATAMPDGGHLFFLQITP